MNILPSTIDFIRQALQNMPCEEFVKRHQNSFKDHFISKPDFETLNNWLLLPSDNEDYNELSDELEIWADLSAEKYRQFFQKKGFDSSLKWLCDGYSDDLWKEWLEYQMNMSDECSDDAFELGDDLLYNITSGWAIPDFLYNLINDLDVEVWNIQEDFCSDEKVMEHWMMFKKTYVLEYMNTDTITKRDMILEELI